MIHTPPRSAAHTAELDRRAAMLARFVRTAPRFSDALRWWAGFDLRREPADPDEEYDLDDMEALLLNHQPGTVVTRRVGYFVAALPGASFRVAEVETLLHEPSLALDKEQRTALRSGTTPLTHILRSLQRATHFTCHIAGDPADDEPALHSRSTLLCAGNPVALVCETVYWRLIAHRTPHQPLHYLHQHGPIN